MFDLSKDPGLRCCACDQNCPRHGTCRLGSSVSATLLLPAARKRLLQPPAPDCSPGVGLPLQPQPSV